MLFWIKHEQLCTVSVETFLWLYDALFIHSTSVTSVYCDGIVAVEKAAAAIFTSSAITKMVSWLLTNQLWGSCLTSIWHNHFESLLAFINKELVILVEIQNGVHTKCWERTGRKQNDRDDKTFHSYLAPNGRPPQTPTEHCRERLW